MQFKENILLKNYTSFKIGGPAKYFCLAENKEDVILAVLVAKKFNLPFFLLGEGTNVLFSDKGYNGMIIRCQASNIKDDNKTIYAEPGVKLASLVKLSSDNSLKGLEWAAGIPGSIGGAVRGNAGAFKESMKSIVKEVEVFDVVGLRVKNFKLKDCHFSYRDSIFKKNPNLIILSVLLRFKQGKKPEIKKKIKEILKYRKEHHPLDFPSAGSVFKNPKGISAGELIDKAGLKGKKINDVEISEKHANFIINLGKGKGEDVLKLIKMIKEKVKDKFKISLEEEIEIL